MKQQEPFDKVIECLREASILPLPVDCQSHDVSFALAWSLFARFRIAHSNDDYDEATAILDKVAWISGDNLIQNQDYRVNALMLASGFAHARSTMFKRPEYREQAIHRTRTLLAELPPEHSFRSSVKFGLSQLQGHRPHGSGVASDFKEALLKDPGVPDHPPFQDQTASLTEYTDLNADSEDKHFYALLSMYRITDEAEVEEAIKYCRLLLASFHHDSDFALLAENNLSILLRRTFFHTNKIEYLNEEISVLRDKFDTRARGALVENGFFAVQTFISSLFIRLRLLRRREDFDEIMQLFPIAVNDEHASAPDRFPVSCDWARFARLARHTST